jgi:hypothetical protein
MPGISLLKIHLKLQALEAGTKQNKQAQNKAGRPDSLASLPDLSACLPCHPDCFILCPLLALVFQIGFFVVATTVLTKQNKARGTCL